MYKNNSIMICAERNRVYAFLIGLFAISQSVPSFAKIKSDEKSVDSLTSTENAPARTDQFQWSEHGKLSWDDFRGHVNATNDESAAATHCGIGFKLNLNNPGKPEVVVYNTFYASRSWVRADAKLESILSHEQGHFDLCEIYTRKLRAQMSKFDFSTPDVKQLLITIYKDVSKEYESRQQAYEQETVHGTDVAAQQKWLGAIASELAAKS
jgi:hypothetical protein